MLFRCLLLLFCLTAICAQKGGRQGSASEESPSRSPSRRILAGRKTAQPSEPIQQVYQEKEDDDKEPEEDREVVAAAVPRRPAPRPQAPRRPSQPQPKVDDDGGPHPAPEPYSFSYSIDDPETGAASSREETQDKNGEIVGYYHIKDKDGRMRRVDYTAGKDGFQAKIQSNEEGINARAPADVSIELSASPSEQRPSYAPNNRPAASETSIKSLGRPVQERFFQRLIPAIPVPAPPIIIEQKREEQSAEAQQISQTYEISDPSDTQLTQQKIVDEEEVPLETAPIKGGPPQSTVILRAPPPTERPIARFTPQRIQSFRENRLISLQPLIAPIAQVREDIQPITQIKEEIPNDINLPAETSAQAPPAPTKSIASQRTYHALRPLSPILGGANVQWSQPQPSVQPQFIQYDSRQQAVAQVQESVPNLAPLSPPSNNIIFQQREHRQPISQQRLLNFLHPIHALPMTQNQQIVFDSPAPQPIQLSYITQQQPQPINTGYQVVVQHREEQKIPQLINQEPIRRELVIEAPELQQRIQTEGFRSESRQLFEPQTYEPLQQTYEPLQQQAEDPAEESRAAPPSEPLCECAKQAASQPQPIKGQPSEPAPVKGSGRYVPPVRAFIPQAFRSS